MTIHDREAPGENRPPTRREFLRATGLGAAGLAAAGLGTAEGKPAGDRAVILLLMVGGPSQLETFDPKPDAPAEVRGPFGSIATAVPGVRLSEHLPGLARRMGRLTLVRSLHRDEEVGHEAGLLDLLPGPSAGATLLPGPVLGAGGFAWDGDRPESAALDLSAERPAVLDAYGPSEFGRDCLRARRLVEAGASRVVVAMFPSVAHGVTWDCHGLAPFSTLDDYARTILPDFDRGFSALIDDLEARGRLGSTLVVAAGEFGRSPRRNPAGGRDHWSRAWSAAMAGGGTPGGRVVGATDAHAGEPIDRPVSPSELAAAMASTLAARPPAVFV